MKLALAQFNPTVGDFAGNTARILALAARAKERGADLAVSPSFVFAVTFPKIYWNVPPLSIEIKKN